MPATGGLLIGLGNFGHGGPGQPGYRLTATNRASGQMALDAFAQLGSYDHTWTGGYPWQPFNDDVHLNVANGNFEVTTVPGLDNANSDILLLSLPPGVGSLAVSSLGLNSGDTVNVLAAVPHLNIVRSGSDAVLSWAAADTNLLLEATFSLVPSSWGLLTNQPVFLSGRASVTTPMTADARFFRLRLR
jgi:hypothetical protein